MELKAKVLLGLTLLDATIGAWLCVWWIKIYTTQLSTQTLAGHEMLRNALAIIVMYIVIRRWETPSHWAIGIMYAISCTSLLPLLISPAAFVLYQPIAAVGIGVILMTYGNALKAQNIPQAQRARFDNLQGLIGQIGAIAGAGLAYFTLFAAVPHWIIWCCVYALFDVDTLVKVTLVKKGFFTYHRA